MIFYILLSGLSLSLVYSKLLICKSNIDCYKNSYCNGGFCQKCLNCTLLFRKGNSCSHDLNQCGECLEGYENISVTNSSTVLKPCEPVQKLKKEQCLSNYDICPTNSYCFQGSCIKCFDCNLYNRLTPVDGCAKQSDECGSCLNGFFEVPVTLKSNIKHCEKIILPPSVPTNTVILAGNSVVLFATLCSMFFFMVAIFFLLKLKKHNSTRSLLQNIYSAVAENSSANEYLEPPPYSMSSNLLGVRNSCSSKSFEEEEEYSIVTYINEEKQQTNMAKIFQQPTATYYCSASEEAESGVPQGEDCDSTSHFFNRPVAEALNVTTEVTSGEILVSQDSVAGDEQNNPEGILTDEVRTLQSDSNSPNEESSL